MNMKNSVCGSCRKAIQVNAAEWNNPEAHECLQCYANQLIAKRQSTSFTNIAGISAQQASVNPDAEFDMTDEELELCNDWDDEEELLWESAPSLSAPSCECGAVKVGSAWHSGWCPIYVNPMGVKE